MNTKLVIGAFTIGLALGLVAMWFIRQPANHVSDRIRKLELDSAANATYARVQAGKYRAIDSLYRIAMDSLSLLSKSVEGRIHDRPKRSLSLDPDSVLKRMRAAAGLPTTGLPPDLQYRRQGVRRQP